MTNRTCQPDLSLAVTAWKTLWLEAHTNQERDDLVWQPTQQLLENLGNKNPQTLTFFTGNPYIFPKNCPGIAIDIFFFGEKYDVAYIGTLLDQKAQELHRTAEVNRLNLINPELAQKMANASGKTIIRNRFFCNIPTQADVLDIEAATEAVKRYLAIRAPKLANCQIAWLPEEEGYTLETQIRSEAEKNFRPSTKEEHILATAQDELEIWI